jgi:hypothetical protein
MNLRGNMRMSTRRGRVTRALGLVLLLCSAGCAFDKSSTQFSAHQPPRIGEPLPAHYWDEVGPAAGKSGYSGSAWLLPFWVSGEFSTIAADAESTTSTNFAVVNPGFVALPWLPLWVSAQTQLDRKDGVRATSRMTWTPLSTSTEDAGWPADEPALRASGFPLLYSRICYGIAAGADQFDAHAILWSLGPAWGRVDLKDNDRFMNGWFFIPLSVAGLGAMVWSSGEIDTQDEELTVHGPLQGYLGYRSSIDHIAGDSTRLLVAGALWFDSADAVDSDEALDTRHGPLWSMFGWGRSDGEPAIYVLWIPVPI